MPINLGPGELYIKPHNAPDEEFEHFQHVGDLVIGVDQGSGEDFSAISVMSPESSRDVPVSVVETMTFQVDRADSERMRQLFELTEIRIAEGFRLSQEAIDELRSWQSGVSRTNEHIARLAEDLIITGNSFVEQDRDGQPRRVEPQRITRSLFDEMLNLPNRYQRPSAVCERCSGEWAVYHGRHLLCPACLRDDWQKAREEEQRRKEAVKPKIQAAQYRYIRVKPAKDKKPAKKKTLPRWR